MTTILKTQNVSSWLSTNDHDLKHKLHIALRARPKDYAHNAAFKKRRWDGWKNFFNEKSGIFLSGLRPEVELALSHYKIPYTLEDQTQAVPLLRQSIGEDFLNDWLPSNFDPIKLHDFQPDLVNQALTYRRGIVKAPTGCHRKGQRVIMFDGSTKMVEDIEVGDILMGPDSTPRKVLQLCRGNDEMYEVRPKKGQSFFVNGDHVLTLVKIKSGNRYPRERKDGELIDTTIREWLDWSKWKKHTHKLIRSGVEFSTTNTSFSIEPYFMGLLLGDGSMQHVPAIHNIDPAIIEVAKSEAKQRGLDLITRDRNKNNSLSHYFVGIKGKNNPLANDLRELGLWGCTCANKFIPEQYKRSRRNVRLQVLAGIIDTDGSLEKNCYYLTVKSRALAEDTAWLGRSLGFYCHVKQTIKSSQNGTEGIYHCVSICGNIDAIPSRIKPAQPRRQKKNVLKTGFEVIKVNDSEDYYGFTVDGDHRYLLDDFTITHNSGKTFILISLLHCLPPKTPVLFLTKNKGLVKQNYEEMKMWGVPNVGIWADKYKEANWITCATAHVDTLDSLGKILPKFRVLFVDEVHDCVSAVPIKAYRKMKMASMRIGFSATPWRYDKKKNIKNTDLSKHIDKVHRFTVKGHFGPVFKTNTTESGFLTTKELQDRGILSSSNCTFYVIQKPDLAYEPYQDAVKLGLEENFEFHKTVVRLARSRPGRTLVIVERIQQGEYLKQLMPEAHWIQGNDALDVREPVINALKTSGDKVCAIVMRPIITAGINIRIHSLINAAGGQAAHNLIQQMGRGLRTADDKDRLEYYDFLWKNNPYLWRHSEWRIDVLKQEGHEVTVKEEFDF